MGHKSKTRRRDIEEGGPRRVGIALHQPVPLVAFVGHNDDISRMCPFQVMIKVAIGFIGILGIFLVASIILLLTGVFTCAAFRPFCLIS
jgi:hypothetical protein